MKTRNINRSIRALALSLCLGVIFTHTTVYAAGPLSGPAGGPTPSNDLMKAPMGGAPGGGGEDKSMFSKPCECKVVDNLQGFFLSQDMPTGTSENTDNKCQIACKSVAQNSGGSQLGMTVTNYLQHKCSVTFKVYGKKNGNNYGGQNPEFVSRVGTGTPAHCPGGYEVGGGINSCYSQINPSVVCGPGFWVENTYLGQPHPVCVKQTVPVGTVPGAQAWQFISGNVASSGAYLFDDNGGIRLFVNATLNCPPGYNLLAGPKVCYKTVPIIPCQ